jgi:CRISPR-associated protein Csc3
MNDEQLELLDDQQLLDFDAGREEAEPVLEPELLTIQLFKQAIRESVGNADDEILSRICFAKFDATACRRNG